jgi:RNA polymerase primary sigma factor
MTEYMNKVARAQRDLVQILGRDPDPEEIGRRVGLPAERVRQILELYRDPISLETPVDDQEDRILGDFIEDRDAVPFPTGPAGPCSKSNSRRYCTRSMTGSWA